MQTETVKILTAEDGVDTVRTVIEQRFDTKFETEWSVSVHTVVGIDTNVVFARIKLIINDDRFIIGRFATGP